MQAVARPSSDVRPYPSLQDASGALVKALAMEGWPCRAGAKPDEVLVEAHVPLPVKVRPERSGSSALDPLTGHFFAQWEDENGAIQQRKMRADLSPIVAEIVDTMQNGEVRKRRHQARLDAATAADRVEKSFRPGKASIRYALPDADGGGRVSVTLVFPGGEAAFKAMEALVDAEYLTRP